jgi:hypothetical protein
MEDLKQYFLPYIFSNILFGLSIWSAWKKPIVARIFLAGFFLWASIVNTITSIQSPQVYLEYANLSFLGIYRDFINGFFAQHIRIFVFCVACGQFLIFLGLCLRRTLTILACLGGMVFGLAIGPLGVGSAFPSTILMAIAFLILFQYHDHDYIWKIRQYKDSAHLRIQQPESRSEI